MKIALGLEYLGSHFYGWQCQPQFRTVQGCVEAALSTVANQPVKVICAGRTDTGVHALAQVIHAEVSVNRPMRSWVLGGNANLPEDISIHWACPVEDEFHARFSALARHYRYVILNRPIRPALLANRVTWIHRPLVVETMQLAGNYLIGSHDFTSYRSVACQSPSPIRTITRLTVTREAEQIIISVSANGFLHHMVRNIAGVLLAVGRGEAPPEWAKTVLEARDRTLGGVTAPAAGLYLSGVDYPTRYSLPKGFEQ